MGNVTTRVGMGYDVHAFADAEEQRPLMLGGLAVPHDRGLAGHSDADVLLHALVDALLGAAALGDIGSYFPSSDERWHNAPSSTFATATRDLLAERGWVIGNVDCTLVAERPRLSPHVTPMRERIAALLSVAVEQISIKSKTTDGLGFTGRQEGIACYAVVLLTRADD